MAKATRIVRSLPGGGAYRKVTESAELYVTSMVVRQIQLCFMLALL
jgi:hypothetical protein